MAQIQNERDKILQAAPVRFETPPNLKAARSIDLLASATQFKQAAGGGSTTPTSITLTAILKLVEGTVSWSITQGVATLVPSGNSVTIAGASMTSEAITVQASLNYDGDTYTRTISITKVADGAPGSPGSPGSPGTRGTVSLFTNIAGSSWSDAVANNLITTTTGSSVKVIGDEVTQANTSATFAQTRYWSGTAWVVRTNDVPASRIIGQLSTGQISGLGALALLNQVNLGTSQVSGNLPNSQVSGLGSLATQNAVNGLTQVTNLGNLAFVNQLAANQIGAGTLAAGVIYAGTISANQVTAGTISASVVLNGNYFYSGSGVAYLGAAGNDYGLAVDVTKRVHIEWPIDGTVGDTILMTGRKFWMNIGGTGAVEVEIGARIP